ncbi:MAG: DUF4446 family protein [Caldilineales bacterium]
MLQFLDQAAPVGAILALLVAAGALGFTVYTWTQLKTLRAQYDVLTAGADGGNLDAVLNQHMENVREALAEAKLASATAERVEQLGRGHVQHVAVLRYNPFSNTGGDQSFVLALADDNGDGALINSLHTRDGTRIYAKPLAAWGSSYMLTEEEQEAIMRARGAAAIPSNGKV